MFIISSILTLTEVGSNDIYDVASSWARGRALVDLREICTMYYLIERLWNDNS